MTSGRTRLARPLPRSDPGSAFRPLAARSLTHALVERLGAAAGVSRTVVREAIAALRAEGLVVTRQGAGAIVAEGARRPFRIDPAALGSLREVLAVMELRTGIEVE